jgi:hypothetical protein
VIRTWGRYCSIRPEIQVPDAQDGAGLAQLGQAVLSHRLLVVPVLARLDPARGVPELSVGAGHDHRPDALRGIGGEHATGAGRLVVGVSMYGHHRERF